jgi:hypothetical protein
MAPGVIALFSRVGITLNLYNHVTPTMQRQAAEAMDGLLSAAK